jgi:glutathionylspermidine synthase
LKGEILKKNQFKKRPKIIKRMKTKLKKIIFGKLGLNSEIKNK